MDKVREDGYYAAIGTGVFGILIAWAGWNVGFSNMTGQGCGIIGAVFILISVGSFIKPESIGQIAMRILKNQQKALLDNGTSQENNQNAEIRDVKGPVINTQGSKNTTITINEVKSDKSNNYDMKVEFSTMLSAGGSHLLAITGMNTGVMPITLSSWGFELPNTNYITEIPTNFPKAIKFPYKLPPGESVTVAMSKEKVAKTLKEANYPDTISLIGFFKDQIKNKYSVTSNRFKDY